MEFVYKSVEFVSELFYIVRYGYKMVVFVFLNGNGVGEGKYLFVYIKIFFGEYDNILEWSFILLILFLIYD